MMQKSCLIVTETGESARTDFEIACYGEHISLCFCSGKRKNKIVVQVVEGEIHVRHVTTTDRSQVIIMFVFLKYQINH